MSTAKVDVSIIIPVYNGGDSIGAQLEKILLEHRVNLEVIVINDGSTDNTREVLSAIQDPRLQVIHQENQGVYAARNAGLAAHRGDWIILLDADDDFTDDMIYQRFTQAVKHDVDIFIANGWRNDFGSRDPATFVHKKQIYNRKITGFEWIRSAVSLREWPHYIWLQIVRSDYIKRNGIIFHLGSSHKDILWTTDLALSNGRFYISDVPDYVYVNNGNSITHSKKYFDARTLSYVGVISQLIAYANEEKNRDVRKALLVHAVEESRHFFGLYRKKTRDKNYAKAQFRDQIRFTDLIKGVNSLKKVWFLVRLYATLTLQS